jgi:predicted phosphodiesterase
MDTRVLGLAVLLFSAVLLTSNYASAAPFTQKDNEAKEEIVTTLAKAVNNSWSQYKNVTAGLHNNSIITIYNQSEAPPPPPPKCPPNTIYNETSKQCEPIPQPPTCPAGQHYNQTTQQCEDDVVIPPPPPPPSDKPVVDVNASKFLRVVALADIDNNNGLVTQLNLAKKYHTKILIIAGDYGYSSCPGLIDKIKAAGFSKDNAIIIQGNHDCGSNTKAFNGFSNLYGNTNFPGIGGKLAVFAIDGNTGLSCTGTQFSFLKQKIQSSNAWYNIPVIHQPYVTVKGGHEPNGQFNCWDPLFRDSGVDLVLQGHNHNYQRINVNGIDYLVVGTGTHDTGSSMYPISSDNWNGFKCLKCITGTNGITLMDFQIDNPNVRNMQGWFLSNGDTVKDKFSG